MAVTRLRIVLVTAMCVVLAVVAGDIFDHVVVGLLAPPVVCGATALLAARAPWKLRLGLAVAAVAVGVTATVLVEDGSPADALRGPLTGPRRLLTTEWPTPDDAQIIAAIAAVLAITSAVSLELAGRRRWHLAPLAPFAVGFTCIVALGGPGLPETWSLIALGALAVVFGLTRQGERPSSRARTLLGEQALAAVLLAVALVAVTMSATLAFADRADPRRTEEAQLTAALLDSVESVVALRSADPPFDLFQITDRSTLIGQSLPARWRVASLDTYDGQRWIATVALRPIGRRLGIPSPPAPNTPPPIRYDAEIRSDDIDLVPFPGRPLSVTADVETDMARTVVRLVDRPQRGDTIQALAEAPPTASVASGALFATRQIDELASGFTELAENLAGSGTELERLQRIESTMREEWALDSGAAGSGQQLFFIEQFVNETRRGTREQFVSAFVLLARALGYDARVATGFVIPPNQLSSPITLRSTHAAVWPEVSLGELGWLAFDPVPPAEASGEEEPPPPPEAQSPAAAQPPVQPPADPGEEVDETTLDETAGPGRWSSVREWLVRAGTTAVIALGPLAAVAAIILLVKWRRRRARLRAPDPAAKVRGAWANTTDSLVDAGLVIAPAWTDRRIAGSAVPLAPRAPQEMRHLAAMATMVTFGPTDDSWRLVDEAITTSQAIDEAIRADRTRWQRLRWRLSLRSLRRSTRSPIR